MTEWAGRPMTRDATWAELPPWRPPQPADLPEWRTLMREDLASMVTLQALSGTINAGQFTLLPVAEGMNASPGAVGAQLLTRAERQRLAGAQLYYVSADMTALARAAAAKPPAEPVSAERLPARHGFMVFAEPIGGYLMRVAEGGAEVPVPIVAVSWGGVDSSGRRCGRRPGPVVNQYRGRPRPDRRQLQRCVDDLLDPQRPRAV